MKKTIPIVTLVLLVLSIMPAFVFAEESSAGISESELTIQQNESVSITPDKPMLYGLERAGERISLMLTFNKAKKAEKGLVYAERRLLEVNQMIQANRLDKAEKAKELYEKEMEKVQARLQTLNEENDPRLELQKKMALQKRLELLNNKREMLETTVHIKVFGNLSETEQEKVNQIVDLLQNSTSKAVIWTEDEVTGAKVRIKAKYALSDESLDKEVKQYEKDIKLDEIKARKLNVSVARLEKRMDAENERIAKLEENGKNVTLQKEKVEVTQELLEKLKEVQATGNFSELNQIVKEARVEAREIQLEKKEVRADHAAEVVAGVITKIEARQTESGKNMSNAITKLTTVKEKLEVRADNVAKRQEALNALKARIRAKDEAQAAIVDSSAVSKDIASSPTATDSSKAGNETTATADSGISNI